MTPQDLGAATIAKYPQYQGMDPNQVGQMVLQKYPQYQSQVSSDPTGNHSFLSNLTRDPFQTLLVNPITRTIQAAQGLAGNQQAGATDQNVNLGPLGKYNVPAVNSAEQIGGDALKTAAYLAPGLGEGSIAAQAGKNALAGAAFGAGNAMQQNASLGDVASQAGQGALVGGAIGGASALASAGLGKLQPYLEKMNLKATATKEMKYQGARVAGGPTRFEEAVQVGTAMPGITPQAKMEGTLSTIKAAESSLDSVIQSPSMQEVAGQLPTNTVIKAFENAANSPEVTSDVRRQLLSEAKTLTERNPDYTPVGFLQDQKKAWGSVGFSEGGMVSNEGKAALQDVYKKLVQDSLAKVDAHIPVPDEMKALFPSLPATLPIEQFNQAYGAVLDYKRLLKSAMTKSEVGFVKRLAAEAGGAILGNTLGGPFGAAAGTVIADQLTQKAPISAVRTLAGKAAKGLAPKVSGIPKVLVRAYGAEKGAQAQAK